MDFNTWKFQVEADFKHSGTQGQNMENKKTTKNFLQGSYLLWLGI